MLALPLPDNHEGVPGNEGELEVRPLLLPLPLAPEPAMPHFAAAQPPPPPPFLLSGLKVQLELLLGPSNYALCPMLDLSYPLLLSHISLLVVPRLELIDGAEQASHLLS